MFFYQKKINFLQICYRYATIKEEESINKDITICSGQGMLSESHIFQSTSEKVSVMLYTSSDPVEQFHFALKYQGNCSFVDLKSLYKTILYLHYKPKGEA